MQTDLSQPSPILLGPLSTPSLPHKPVTFIDFYPELKQNCCVTTGLERSGGA